MKDFLDQLDERLQAMADATVPVPARPVRRLRRRPAFLAGATASLAALGTVFAMSGTSLADLPILETPTTDATSVQSVAPGARQAGVDFTKAHAFPTANGPGYVFLTPQKDVLCLSVPLKGRYPGACAPPALVERDGLAFESVGDLDRDPSATSTFVFILPDGATRAKLIGADRVARDADAHAGVVTAQVRERTTVRWTVAGRTASRTFEGPFAAGGTVSFGCPDGRTVEAPLKESVLPDGSGRIKPSVEKRLCG